MKKRRSDYENIHWTIKITWEDKKEEYIADIPDWVAQNVDEYLTKLEEEREEGEWYESKVEED